MNSWFYILWIILCCLLGYNLVLPLVLFVIYKFRFRSPHQSNDGVENDYAIIVTAYEQTDTLRPAVASLLNLNYANYLIYVVADKCDISDLRFGSDKVILLRPEDALQSNTRSHLYAIERFQRPHQYLTIIDSDNLVDPNYLKALDQLFNHGFEAVQGVRKAKNLDTLYACLDAVQDIYYHFYDRRILFGIGSSATLAGSGMAFSTSLYKEFLARFDIRGAGFDKALQLFILEQKKRIAFAGEAIVYDEKTSRSDQLVKQRARWFNTWFRYAFSGTGLFFRGIKNLNWNQFWFALLFLRPPLFLVVLISTILMVGSAFISWWVFWGWLAAFAIFAAAVMLALVQSRADRKIYRALTGLPLFMYYQVLSLMRVRKANKISVATQHYHHKTIDELKP